MRWRYLARVGWAMKGSSQLLINEPPLQVLPSLAKLIGLNEAMILQQIHYWLIQKKAYQRDGRTWVFNTYKQWQEDNFPFWSERAIQRIILNLEEKGLLIVEQFNLQIGDATKFYSIHYDKLAEICTTPSSESGTTPSSESGTTPSSESGTTHHPNLALPSSESGTILIRTETTTETTRERESTPPISKSILSVLIAHYKDIASDYKGEMALKNQATLLEGKYQVADLESWLASKRSLSSIGFIANDFKTWLTNQARQKANGQQSDSPRQITKAPTEYLELYKGKKSA